MASFNKAEFIITNVFFPSAEETRVYVSTSLGKKIHIFSVNHSGTLLPTQLLPFYLSSSFYIKLNIPQ